jgi:hypothetical protein
VGPILQQRSQRFKYGLRVEIKRKRK